MYNIHNHYNNIYSLAKSITGEPSVIYLHPFGSSGVENIEVICNLESISKEKIKNYGDNPGVDPRSGPVVFCYDQEPLIPSYNSSLFSYVKSKFVWFTNDDYVQDVILVNTELDSDAKDQILADHGVKDCYYFHHAFTASDWYRGYQFLNDLIPPSRRTLTKKFITFNRITSNARIYRSLLVNELIKHSLLDHGYVSFSRYCPDGTSFSEELTKTAQLFHIPTDLVDQTIQNISSCTAPLRIDHKDDVFIPNNSFHINAISENMESFVHVVTETCYWGRKKHLTEKIFKPIVMRQPFILVGCAHNLEYLKSYGFKTFDRWWDESYDTIEDDVERMHAIGQLLADTCQNDLDRLKEILLEMEEVLEHNYRWFYNPEFLNNCWSELVTNLSNAIKSTP